MRVLSFVFVAFGACAGGFALLSLPAVVRSGVLGPAWVIWAIAVLILGTCVVWSRPLIRVAPSTFGMIWVAAVMVVAVLLGTLVLPWLFPAT